MSRFRLSAGGSRAHEPWFRVGTLDVNTTWLVVFAGAFALLAYAVGRDNLEVHLAFLPQGTLIAQHPWTLLTWPFAILGSSGAFNFVIGLFFIWYFGRDLEASVFGRAKFAGWLALVTVTFALIDWALVSVIQSWLPGSALYGLQFLGLAVLVLWAGEWPHRPFFFGIPAWVLGAVYVAIQVLQDVHDTTWALLWTLLIGLAVSAVIARQYGALNEFNQIPRFTGSHRPRTRTRTRKTTGSTVVQGPWDGTRPTQVSTAPVVNKDSVRMDELLDKISAHGTESLTESERRELEELRLRRRR